MDFVCLTILNWSNAAAAVMLCQWQSSFLPGERSVESGGSPQGSGSTCFGKATLLLSDSATLSSRWPALEVACHEPLPRQATKHRGMRDVLLPIAHSGREDWCTTASSRISWPLWAVAVSSRGLLRGKTHRFHVDSGEKINFTTLLLERHEACQSGKNEPYHCYRITESQNGRVWKGPLWVI